MSESSPYACLQRDYTRRKRRYLRMIASQGLASPANDAQLPALFRKYLRDREVDPGADPSKGWVRMRTRPDPVWRDSISAAQHDRKGQRVKEEHSFWTDDAIFRSDDRFAFFEESVGTTMARLAALGADATGDDDGTDDGADDGTDDGEDGWVTPSFPPADFAQLLPAAGAPTTAKVLMRVIAELEVTQLVGGDMFGKTVRETFLDRVKHVEVDAGDALRVATLPPGGLLVSTDGALRPDQQLAALAPATTTFMNTLHVPVAEPSAESRGDFVARWGGRFPGIDPSLLLDAFGFDHATTLLEVRGLYPNTADVREIVDTHAWLASLAQQPFRTALPALSDMVAFRQVPAWDATTATWTLVQNDTAWVAPAPALTEMLADGDDFLYRTLVAQKERADPAGERHFRLEPGALVPAGWRWPADEPAFIYWWRAVLWGECAAHALLLKDDADFHVAQLIRFAYLCDLFGDSPNSHVPRFVAECVRATLLNFKYWFDEPPQAGNKRTEMTFWSENHQILFHSSQFLAGQLFPDDVFPRSGTAADGGPMTGAQHMKRGRERAERWLDRRLAFGFSEWCAPGYYDQDFSPVLNLVDFSGDSQLATRAAMVADLLVFDLARNSCRGSFGVTAGRAYFKSKAYGWAQSVGEGIEVLFGTRGDHLQGENTGIALSTSPRYVVPDALLAIGRDRALADRSAPMTFRSRASIDVAEGPGAGIGFSTDADAAFWWGLGAYFHPATMELTHAIAERYDNLRTASPLKLAFKFDEIAGYLEAVLVDAAEALAGAGGTWAGQLLLFAPFPVNLVAIAFSVGSLKLTIEGVLNLIVDLASMILFGLESAVNLLLGEDPPKPRIPQTALRETFEALLAAFNAGSILGRANLYTYSAGDAMLSSAQNHMAQAISLQKQPWMASLGCDACVWTNAPMEVSTDLASAGWEVFKHVITVQADRVIQDVMPLTKEGLDDMKEEGLRDWGGSICLPKVAQHRSVTIVAYDFPPSRSVFSARYSHAWFPAEFFDEVVPAPEDDTLLPERDGGGTWVFGRKDDGYVALCSARRARWLRDDRFDDDPDPAAPGKTIGEGRFTTTELRAEDGSNIWVCAIGTRTQFGSFDAFRAKVRDAYLHFSGVGSIEQLQCTFDMPEAPGTGEPGFRWELFFGDDEAHLDGETQPLDDYPRFGGPYVAGRGPGRVEWGDPAYRIVHPTTGLWVSHDRIGAQRHTSEPQPCVRATRRLAARQLATLHDAVELARRRGKSSTTAGTPAAPATPAPSGPPHPGPGRTRRFRLEPEL